MYVLKGDLQDTLKEEEVAATTSISQKTNNCRGFGFLVAVILQENELCDSLHCYPLRTRSPGGSEAQRGGSGGGARGCRGLAPSWAVLCRAGPPSGSHAQGEASWSAGRLLGPPRASGCRVSAEPLGAGLCLAAGGAVRSRTGCGQLWRLAVLCLPLKASVRASE